MIQTFSQFASCCVAERSQLVLAEMEGRNKPYHSKEFHLVSCPKDAYDSGIWGRYALVMDSKDVNLSAWV